MGGVSRLGGVACTTVVAGRSPAATLPQPSTPSNKKNTLTRAAHADQQSVTPRVGDDACDAAHVADGIIKQHQVHDCR